MLHVRPSPGPGCDLVQAQSQVDFKESQHGRRMSNLVPIWSICMVNKSSKKELIFYKSAVLCVICSAVCNRVYDAYLIWNNQHLQLGRREVTIGA